MHIIGNEEVQAVRRVIESRQLFRYRGGEGGETDLFEKEWSEKIGAKHTIAMANGTGALICAMVGLGIGPGDEVIIPAYTFMATALAPLAVGAVPILAEIDESQTIDPADLQAKITPRTKAIMPVHMCGLPCDMDAVMAIAKKHDIPVVEDACQADGGAYKGKHLGTIGQVGAFSFNQFKLLTCGEGGALVTDDDAIYQRALIHHDGGCVFREHADQMQIPFFAGGNLRINEILSAILRVQLTRLDTILAALRREKKTMTDALADETAFTFSPVHDPEGDCGVLLALLFDSAAKTRAFVDNLTAQDVPASTPIDSGRHVYTNWEPIMKQHGAHHPARDAFKLTDHPPTYTPDMCPKTLSILKRTAYLPANAQRPPHELEHVIAKIKNAADQLRA